MTRANGEDAARALALLLTVLLTAAWAALAWPQLSERVLPHPDDMLRLAQIRDWLAGQAFADLTQARLGAPAGIALHWSRLPDLVPALIIAVATPIAGQARAELIALVFWPELLFFCHLLLAAALARRLGPPASAPLAVALAALAYPAIEAFVPGALDHHGLQIVLVELMLVQLAAGRLFVAGLVAGISQLVGLETAPAILAAMAALLLLWVQARRPVAGFGAGLIVAALAGFLLLRPQGWGTGWCDGFTPGIFAMALIGGGAWLILAALAPRLPDRRWRGGAALAVAALALASAWAAAPDCFGSPYGAADPLLARLWPAGLAERGGVLGQTIGTAIAELGLAAAGLAGALWLMRGRRAPAEVGLPLLLVLATSFVLGLVQLRAGMFAAALAAPVLAQLVERARWRGRAPVALASLAGMGLAWQAAGLALGAETERPPRALALLGAGCRDARTLEQLDRLDPGLFAAPLDMSAYLIGATGHQTLAGPIHRNIRGNRAVYDFFLAPVDSARYQALLWTIDYVALCPESFAELPPGRVPEGSLLAALRRDDAPVWLEPVLLAGSRARAWRVRAGTGL